MNRGRNLELGYTKILTYRYPLLVEDGTNVCEATSKLEKLLHTLTVTKSQLTAHKLLSEFKISCKIPNILIICLQFKLKMK
jgi:hypothetical protein